MNENSNLIFVQIAVFLMLKLGKTAIYLKVVDIMAAMVYHDNT